MLRTIAVVLCSAALALQIATKGFNGSTLVILTCIVVLILTGRDRDDGK